MNRSAFFFLIAASFLVVFLALEPLLGFALFGSDTGEYYRITAALMQTGAIPHGSAYLGWGTGYPDFPGIFLLAGSAGGALGADPLSSLLYVIPAIAVLSILPLFLLFRRLVSHDLVSVLGAALATIAMPRLFSIAHPAPLALGDFFVVAGLWTFVEGRRDFRWYVPLFLIGGALIVTHHLSSYFLLVSALGGLILFSWLAPSRWSTRFPRREFVFFGVFSAGLLSYWFFGAPSFFRTVGQSLPGGLSQSLLEAGLVLLFGGLVTGSAFLLRWRRSHAPRKPLTVRLPTDRSVLRDALAILAVVFVAVTVLVVVPVPGTTQRTSLAAVLFFSPLLASVGLGSGSRRLFGFFRLGPLALTWLGALGISAGLAIATSNPVIIPSRHAEYGIIPVMLMVAVGSGRLIARGGDAHGRKVVVAGGLALVILVAANAAIVYPPPRDFGGFQEGLTYSDAGTWMWVGVGIPSTAVVASDHRLSSMIFGFDGNRATWDSTKALFTGHNFANARADLLSSYAPHSLLPVWVVVVDAAMYDGVALDPNASAAPLSAEAQGWFAQPPFVPLYENGLQVVYWVDDSTLPA